MKYIFYTFVLLFITVTVHAQKLVSYVAFFPSAAIHNSAKLTQDTDSFSLLPGSGNVYNKDKNYAELKGGLILGAADNSNINIGNMKVQGDSSGNTINLLYADNVLTINSTGTVNNISIGNGCSGLDSCTNIVLSSNRLIWPLDVAHPVGLNVDVSVKNLAHVRSLLIQYNTGAGNTRFSDFIPPIGKDEDIGWVHLRINGSEYCKRYLVKYTGSKPSNKCQDPDDPEVAQYWNNIK